jgi:hypothetical protein
VLVVAKPTYKGLIVPGGKVDMMFTAKGFGKEDGEQQTCDMQTCGQQAVQL